MPGYSRYNGKNYKGSKSNKKIKSKLTSSSKTDKISEAISIVNSKVDHLKADSKKDKSMRVRDVLYTFNPLNNPTIQLLNGMIKGNDDSTRDGDHITIKSVKMKVAVTPGDTTNLVRVILVFDKQANAADISLGTLFSNYVALGPVFTWKSFANPDRFSILYDRTFNVSQAAYPQAWDSYSKSMNYKVSYNQAANSGTSADIARNSLWLITCSDSGAAPHPLVVASTRIKYVA